MFADMEEPSVEVSLVENLEASVAENAVENVAENLEVSPLQ